MIAVSKSAFYLGIEFDDPDLALLITKKPYNIWFDTTKVESTIEKVSGNVLCAAD